MSEFYPGLKVVCVDDCWRPHHLERLPSKDSVYVVRDVTFFSEQEGIRLAEIVNAPRGYDEGFHECSFLVSHFRPLKEDPIEIFRQMCRDVEVKSGKKEPIQ